MKIDLQLFKGNTTNTTTYTASPEEKALLAQQLKYQEAFYPSVIGLNKTAGDLLWDSYGTVQADYNTMNTNAQNQIAQAQNTVNQLNNGILPSAYQTNAENAIRSGVQNTVGDMVNSLGNRGVLNSSVTNKGLNDIESNVASTMAQNYNNNLSTASQLAQQKVDNATQPIVASSAAQEAAQQPALNLWNASLGLQSSGNNVLGNIAGKYGTKTTTQSGGGGGFLGGITSLGSAWLGNSGYVNKNW